MITIQRLQRMWDDRQYGRLSAEVLGIRPESVILDHSQASAAMASAALTLLRLDELSQAGNPLYSRLVRAVIAGQQADGGWGDLLTTAVCLRALSCGRGNGVAIDRGMLYFARLQKPDGIWPAEPLRRMPEDAFTSAFILLELCGDERFQSAVDVSAAIRWFEQNIDTLDRPAIQLWEHARLRVRRAVRIEWPEPQITLWS